MCEEGLPDVAVERPRQPFRVEKPLSRVPQHSDFCCRPPMLGTAALSGLRPGGASHVLVAPPLEDPQSQTGRFVCVLWFRFGVRDLLTTDRSVTYRHRQGDPLSTGVSSEPTALASRRPFPVPNLNEREAASWLLTNI